MRRGIISAIGTGASVILISSCGNIDQGLLASASAGGGSEQNRPSSDNSANESVGSVDSQPTASSERSSDQVDKKSGKTGSDYYKNMPLTYEKNLGQSDAQVKFLSRVPGYNIYLTSTAMIFDVMVQAPSAESLLALVPGDENPSVISSTVRANLVGANPDAAAEGDVKLQNASNYFLGKDPGDWIRAVPHYGRVTFTQIYDGVDLVYYQNEGILEHDFVVFPGTNTDVIRLAFDGAQGLSINDAGELVIKVSDNTNIKFKKPYAYLDGDKSQEISAEFNIISENEVTFSIGEYDHSKVLTIDPSTTLDFSTFHGKAMDEVVFGVASDQKDDIFVAGYTKSANFATSNAADSALSGSLDAFVSKFTSDGDLIFTTYFGGTGLEIANSIAVDKKGSPIFTGYTTSTNLPTTDKSFQEAPGSANCGSYAGTLSPYDGYIAKLKHDGSDLVAASYMGGCGFDRAAQVIINHGEKACVVGTTTSSDLLTALQETKNNLQANLAGDSDAFALCTKKDFKSLEMATFLGGSARELGVGIARGGKHDLFVLGETRSVDFPMTTSKPVGNNAGSSTFGGDSDAFLVRFRDSGKDPLSFATYLGGSSKESPAGLAIANRDEDKKDKDDECDEEPESDEDKHDDDVVIMGWTDGAGVTPFDTPISGSGQGGADIFLAKYKVKKDDPASRTYVRYFGGAADDKALNFENIKLNSCNEIFLNGVTMSSDFPTANAIAGQGSLNGISDAFVTKLSASDSPTLLMSTYLGGADQDIGVGLAMASDNEVLTVGMTMSTDFPAVDATQPGNGGGRDGFVSKIKITP